MFKKYQRALWRILQTLILCAVASATAAETLHIEIDTAGLGDKGWLDLMFNSSNGNASAAQVRLFDFAGFDTATPVQTTGNVFGTLGSAYSMDNLSNAELFSAVHLGATLSFNVSFSGSSSSATNLLLSTLSVSLYGADQMTLLGNGDVASGSLLHLYWTPSTDAATAGAVGVRVFDGIVSVSPVAAVPEPESWMMMGVGMGVLLLAGRRRTSPFTA